MAENVSIVIKAFDKTAKGFGTVGKGLVGITRSIVSMRSALILAGGAAGFGFLVKRSLNATDGLKKTADKIGTTTEALGGLRFAAQISGVEVRTMDMALQRFTRRTAEAAKGTGEAKGAIKELGIDAKELNKMPLDKRMLVLADAFGKVTNDSDKLRLAFKLFDSEGAALVNTLGLGREGLTKLLGEAKLLGLTMSQNAAAGVEKANDSILKLMSVGKGLTDQFSAALAPAIEDVVTQLTEFFMKISADKGGVEQWARGMAIAVVDSIVSIAKGLNSVLQAIDSFGNKAMEILGKFEKKVQAKRVAKMTEDLVELGMEINRLGSGDFTMTDILGDLVTFDSFGKKAERFNELNKQILLETEKLSKMAETKPLNLGDFLNIEALVEKTERLKKAIASGGEGTTFVAPLVKDISNVDQAFKDWSDTVLDNDQIVQSFTKNALNGMTDALTAGITGAANFADAMKSMAKSVVDSLIKMLIQKYIVDAAFGAITGFIGGGGTGATGGTAASGGIGMGQGFSATAAIGGSVNRGQPTLVGERGQEVFVPNQNGAIIPNDKLGGGSGVTINQTINVSTGVQQTVRAEIATLMPQIANAAKGAVADARQRGGGFSKALVGA